MLLITHILDMLCRTVDQRALEVVSSADVYVIGMRPVGIKDSQHCSQSCIYVV